MSALIYSLSVQVLEKGIYKKHFGRFATGYTDFHSWSDMKIPQKLKAKYKRDSKAENTEEQKHDD